MDVNFLLAELDLEVTVKLLGILVTVTGLYEIYSSITPESKSFFADPHKKPFSEVRLNENQARKGLVFAIIGFLIQMITLVL